MIETLKTEIKELIEPYLRNEGAEIADLVLSQYKSKSTLRLFIYTDNKTTLGECIQISRLVGEIIDGTDYFKSGYTLEVSSPGLDRPLNTMMDFKYRVGEKVKILFVDKKRKKITAEIIGTDNENILLKNSEGEFSLNLAEIEQAKIIF